MNKTKCLFVILIISVLLSAGAACQRTQWGNLSLTPTEVLKFQNEAMKNKHVGMIKHTLSRDSMRMIEERAKERGMTLDEFIKQMPDEMKSRTFEFRNERIAGDTATVEVKNHHYNQWTTAYFVKENGGWKVDLVTELKWKSEN